MSLTFGYDLKDGDKILEAPKQLSNFFLFLESINVHLRAQ
jgi:hypothetical protein